MTIPSRRLSRRVAFLLRLRRQLRAQAPAFVLLYYRRSRRLPPAYVLSLLSSSAVRRIRLRGEIEHMIGLAGFLASRTERTRTGRQATTLDQSCQTYGRFIRLSQGPAISLARKEHAPMICPSCGPARLRKG